MRIESVETEYHHEHWTMSARFIWENVDRPSQDIFIKVYADDSYAPANERNAFLVAGVVPALLYGERRIRVDSGIDPWLYDHLQEVIHYLHYWYWYDLGRKRTDVPLPQIEAPLEQQIAYPLQPRTSCFLSGGIDSIHMVSTNRMRLSADHPGYIKDAIVVHGFDMGTRPKRGAERAYFENVLVSLRPFSESVDLTLIPVYTNLRLLAPTKHAWLSAFQGPAMAAVAHALAGRITDAMIASTLPITDLQPWGTHPLIDPQCSSYSLRITHYGADAARLEKVRIVAQSPEALRVLRVCFFGDSATLNCGKCNKCVRTMLELACVGKLAEASTLPGETLSAELVRNAIQPRTDEIPLLEDIIRNLRHRRDLAAVLRQKVAAAYLRDFLNPRTIVRSMDRGLLGGRLLRLIRKIRNKGHSEQRTKPNSTQA